MSEIDPLKLISMVDRELYAATKGDNRFGGDLLRDTAQNVNKKICEYIEGRPSFLEGQQVSAVVTAWKDLVDDVRKEYQWERQILEHNLEIREFRPRTFFSVLPEADDWQMLADAPAELKVQHLRLNPSVDMDNSSRTVPGKRLSILLPVTNGYRKTFRALACLCYDIEQLVDEYQVEFHICVNFSDDDSLNQVTRFANTMARSREFAVALYYSEKPEKVGAKGRQGQWWKTVVLNLMLKRLFESSSNDNCKAEEHYLHFADDDIYIQPGTRVIQENITHLQDPNVQIVSASYTSRNDKGFSAISSVRKRNEYVHSDSDEKFLNIYGGCMTTTMDRLSKTLGKGGRTSLTLFPRSLTGGEEFSEDCYLTVLANIELLEQHSVRKIDPSSPPEMNGYALRRVMVGHQEPTNIVSFAYRVARDIQWGRRSVEACIPDSGDPTLRIARIARITEVFGQYRKQSFEPVNEAIRNNGNLRHILAEAWNLEIRELIERGLERFQDPSSMRAINWITSKTQHQICKDIIEDQHLWDRIKQDAIQAPSGYELIECLREYASQPALGFPKLCKLLIKSDRPSIETTLYKNEYLFHLYTIAEESLANAAQFLLGTGTSVNHLYDQLGLTREKVKVLRKTYRFDLGLILSQVDEKNLVTVAPARRKTRNQTADFLCSAPRLSPNSYTVFLWRNPAKQQTKVDELPDDMFLRYFNVTGRSKFLNDSPRRTVYLQVIGDVLLERILKVVKNLDPSGHESEFLSDKFTTSGRKIPNPQLRVTRTLYPTLQQATLSYSGPEQRTHLDRLMQSLYIQESIRSKAKQLSAVALGDEQCRQVAYCLGQFLGQMHGVTFGARAYLDRTYVQKRVPDEVGKKDVRRGLIQLLVEYLDQLRRFVPRAYKHWLEQGADRWGSIQTLINQIQSERGTVGGTVATLLRQDGLVLEDIWDDLCLESEQLHKEYGAIGHQGLYAANLFIGRRNEKWEVRNLRGRKSTVLPPHVYVDEIYLADHSGITMIDPAVEAGVVLAELISSRISAGTIAIVAPEFDFLEIDDQSLPAIVDVFRNLYYEILQRYLSPPLLAPWIEEDKIDLKRTTTDIIARLSRVAAISLLSHYHDKREYDLTPDQREKLIHICVDLLHVGTNLKLRFRDYHLT